MDKKSLEEIQDNELIKKRLAKLIAHDCFRNTELENFHADPDSRLSDAEMKELMIDVVNHTYSFVSQLFGPDGERMVEQLKNYDPVPEWDEPKFPR